MNFEWEGEFEVSDGLAFKLIKEQFPIFKKISFLASGWDNRVFLADDVIFRFPKGQMTTSLIEIEWKILPLLQSKLPYQIPKPKLLGQPNIDYPFSFIGYDKILGKSADECNLSDKEREKLVTPIATFLKALHKLDPSILKECSSSIDFKSKLDSRHLIPMVLKNLHELHVLQLIEKAHLSEIVLSLKNLREPIFSTFVHGDFYFRHIILNQGQLTGIIDWGDMHIGDPAIDLSILFSFFPIECKDKFLEIYGKVSKETLELAQLRAIFLMSALAIFGHYTKNKSILIEALKSLKRMENLILL